MPTAGQSISSRRLPRFIALVFITAFMTCPLLAQSEFYGRIFEKVVCEADETQGYTLYVPSYYSRNEKWPVIFCFDASARGLMPVDRLRVAAEKYGYIVAGSLNSRNGPWQANSTAAQAMIKDLSAHFSIDPRRVYTTGVSGGARVATALGLAGVAKGVIACSGGFPVPEDVPRQIPFIFLSTAGVEDFNYQELCRLDDELEQRQATHRLIIFEGGHEWASSELMVEAVEWLELQAMKQGARPKDDSFIQQMLEKRAAALPSQVGREKLRAIQSLVADFSVLIDVADFNRQLDDLIKSGVIKQEMDKARRAAESEMERIRELSDVTEGSAGRKRKMVADLRKQADAAGNSVQRQTARRIIAAYFSMQRETLRGLFEEQEYGRAAALLELSSMLRVGDKQILFDLARARALAGDRKGAVEALHQSMTAGFGNLERVKAEPAFEKLAGYAGFKEFVARYSEKAVEPTMEMPVMRVSAVLASVELRVFSQPNVDTATRPLSFLRVEKVRMNTTASRAGIVPGMEILAIQGIRVRGLREDELQEIMQLNVQSEIVLLVREPPLKGERELRIPLRKAPPVEESPYVTVK